MNEKFNLLPNSMQDAIRGLKELHNTPDSMAIVCVLAVANLATSRLYNIDSGKYGIRPTSLFLVNLASTGARKSTNFRELTWGIRQYQKLKEDELKNEKIRYSIDEKRYKSKLKEYEKSLEDDSTVGTVEVPSPPRPIETADYELQTGTRNGIINSLKSQCFAGLLSSEAGEFFSSHSFKDKNTAVELAAFLTNLWDGADVKKQTGMESVTLKNRRLTMAFLLQSEVFQDVMNNPVFSEQGFMHRILITQTGNYKKVPWEFTPEADQREEAARNLISAFNNQIYHLMLQPHKTMPARHYELEPTIMNMTEEAKLLLGQYYNATLDADEKDLKHYGGFAQRLHEHAIRLAATVAAYEGAYTVLERHAACAIQLMDYFTAERKALEIGVTDWDQNRSDGANKLLMWWKEKTWTGSRRELTQFGPVWFRKLNTEQKDQIIKDLLREEEIVMETVKGKNNREYTQFSLAV